MSTRQCGNRQAGGEYGRSRVDVPVVTHQVVLIRVTLVSGLLPIDPDPGGIQDNENVPRHVQRTDVHQVNDWWVKEKVSNNSGPSRCQAQKDASNAVRSTRFV